mgnify:CR=1 FL=1
MSSVNVITIDGPSGVGKGTAGGIIAKKLKYNYLDSGALYRLLALAARRHNVFLKNETALVALAGHFDIAFEENACGDIKTFLEGEDVSSAMRSESVAEFASQLAIYPSVRSSLLDRQRLFAVDPGLIADGRDMGTVVFPDAALKFFLNASFDTRVTRRHKQLIERGENVSLRAVQSQLDERDRRDKSRLASPLIPAEDAVEIDTSGMTADEVVNTLLEIVSLKGLFAV